MKTLSLLALVLLMSCQVKTKKHEESTFTIDSVRIHIEQMNASYSKRFISNDAAFYEERYCVDAAVYAPGMPAVVGRDSIRSFFYGNGEGTAVTIELPIGQVYGNEDLVVEDGTYNFPDGQGGSFEKGKFIALWKKEDGKWKLYREIWNADHLPKQ